MKRDIALNLLRKMKDENFLKQYKETTNIKLNVSKLIDIDDASASEIIDAKNMNEIIFKTYLALYKDYTDEEIYDYLMYDKEVKFYNFLLALAATDQNLLMRDDAKDIIEIISNAKQEYNQECAAQVVLSNGTMKRKEIPLTIDLISNAEEEFQAEYAKEAAINENLIKSNRYNGLIERVRNAETEFGARKIEELITCPELINNVNLGKIICEMENIQEIPQFANDEERFNNMIDAALIANENNCDCMKFVIVVATAKEKYHHVYMLEAMKNSLDLMKMPNAIKYLELIGQTKTELQAEYLSYATENCELLERRDSLKIMKFISEIEDEEQIDAIVGALGGSLIQKDNIIPYLEILKCFNKREELLIIKRLLFNINFVDSLDNDKFKLKELVEEIEKDINEDNNELIYMVACDKDVLKRTDYLEIIRTFAQLKTIAITKENSDYIEREKILSYENITKENNIINIYQQIKKLNIDENIYIINEKCDENNVFPHKYIGIVKEKENVLDKETAHLDFLIGNLLYSISRLEKDDEINSEKVINLKSFRKI